GAAPAARPPRRRPPLPRGAVPRGAAARVRGAMGARGARPARGGPPPSRRGAPRRVRADGGAGGAFASGAGAGVADETSAFGAQVFRRQGGQRGPPDAGHHGDHRLRDGHHGVAARHRQTGFDEGARGALHVPARRPHRHCRPPGGGVRHARGRCSTCDCPRIAGLHGSEQATCPAELRQAPALPGDLPEPEQDAPAGPDLRREAVHFPEQVRDSHARGPLDREQNTPLHPHARPAARTRETAGRMSGEARLPLPRDPRPAEDAGVWWCEGGTPLRGPAHVELPQFLPLTQFYIGRFASTNHSVLFLWVRGSGADKSLVIVVVQDQTKPQPARTLRRFKLALRDCPFFAPLVVGDETKRPFRGICAFEMRLSDIQGLDYLNPLIVNASRLVVEAKRLTKRWFPTLGHCARHYSWDPPSLEPSRDRKARVESLLSELYRPRARSEAQWEAEEEPHEEEEEVVSLPQVVPRSEFCSRGAAAEPRSYVLDNWEEKNYETLNRLVLGAERMLRVKSEVHEAKRSPPSAQSTPCRCRRAPAQSGPCRCRRARPVQTQEAEPEPEPSFVEVIHNTTVCVRFDDPFLPYVLREVMHDPEHPHLLRLYESGLPSWAIYLPQYLGGFYRRWMRVAFSMLLLVLSCVSLLLGLYDLFSTFPSLHRTLKGILLMPICKWMEEVVAAKWAVLLGWLLPSQTLVRYFRSSFQLCASCAAYFVSSLSFFFYSTVSWSVPTLLPWVEFVVEPLGGVLCAGFALVRSLVVVIRGVLAACRGGVWSAAAGLGRLFSSPGGGAPITTMGLLSMQANAFRKACMGIYHGTIYFCVLVAKHQASLRLAIRRCLRRMWRYVASAVSRMPVCAGLFALAATALLVLALCKGAPPGLPEHGAASGGGAGTGGHAVGHEPAVLAVDLLCASSAPERCWDPRRGGARCGCPYRDLRALNVTLGHPGTVSFEVPPHRFPNGSATRQVRCRGAGHCLVPARSLRNIFAGGAAEVWAMGSPRAAG
ncbi:unnamed protein product, partial [Prorocentrum cordatum]